MEKNIKENVYPCITESLRGTAEINIVNQPYFNKKINLRLQLKNIINIVNQPYFNKKINLRLQLKNI